MFLKHILTSHIKLLIIQFFHTLKELLKKYRDNILKSQSLSHKKRKEKKHQHDVYLTIRLRLTDIAKHRLKSTG